MSGKRLFVPILLLLVFAMAGLMMGGPAFGAGTATMLRDINPVGADPYDDSGVAGNLLSLGRVALLVAREVGSGRELWVSDGTDAGTRPLIDLCPGECSSDIELLGRVGTTGLLRMGRYPTDPVLWRSDGTPAGTFPLFEGETPRLCAGRETVATASAFFFTAEVGDGCGLWKTDGTRAGTVPLRQFTDDDFDGLSRLTVVGDRLYFVTSVWAGTHPEVTLWRTDGTAGGTLELAVWTASSSISDLVAVGPRLFFVAPVPVANGGYELWSSDGTPAGTRPVTGFTPLDPFVPRFGDPSNGRVLQAVDSQLCFLANDDVDGRELWCSDGTPAGTRRVTDFPLANPFVDLERWRIEKLGQRLVFPANNGNGNRLWTSTGLPASTAQIASSPELAPRATLIRSGARVFFLGSRAGKQLWTSDGTSAGTRIVHRVCPEQCEITSLTPLLGKLFFGASEISGSTSLWVADGSETGTRRLVELGSVFSDELILGRPAQVGNRGLLAMEDGDPRSGVDLWTTDGNPAGTSRVTRIGGNGEGSSPRQLVPAGPGAGNGVRFLTTNPELGGEGLWSSLGTEESTVLSATGFPAERLVPLGNLTLGFGYFALWRSDGTQQGTYQLISEQGNVAAAVSLPGRVVFVQRLSEEPEYEVWSTDGTLDGTQKIFDLPADSSFLSDLTALGGKAYFVTTRSNHEDQLWETDGTAAGTRAVTTQEHLFIQKNPLLLTRVGSTLYFLGDDDQAGREVWRADGTPGGTRSVAEGLLTNIADLGAFQGSVYIVASRSEFPYPYGLWKTDGTDAGTVLVAELPRPASTSGLPAQFTPLGSLLYFVVERELWRTDGTTQGTLPLLEASASHLPDPRELTGLNGRLFFVAGDPEHGRELWESDGTVAGTRPVQDIAPGAFSSEPQELVASGGKLFFTANDGVHGREPWVYAPTGSGCVPSETALCLGDRFRVEADWRDFTGGSGRGTAVVLTGDTGYFWFFDPSNVEVILKVLDGEGLNGHHWVFYGALSSVEYTLTVTDTQTGAVRRYINPSGVLGSVADTQAFGPQGAHLPGVVTTGPAPIGSGGEPRLGLRQAKAEASCAPSATRLCLNDGRFAVEARWKDFQGNTGTGKAVALGGGDTGYFWFFDQDNVEVVLKVLDGRPLNGKFWVFYGALSTVEYTLTVTDTVTGTVKTYTNPSGRLASVADTGAF